MISIKKIITNDNTSLQNTVRVSEKTAMYDTYAKSILTHKIILANILISCIPAFYGMEPKAASELIEGKPLISTINVDSGYSNSFPEKIIGLNTESNEIKEGKIFYDIIFYALLPDRSAKIIVNVEIQKSQPSNYFILNRSSYYVSRLISSQKEREFKGSDYNGIKKVYSVWICLNMPSNSLTSYSFQPQKVYGIQNWKGSLDLANIIMIGLKKEDSDKSASTQNKDTKTGLHNLLNILFSTIISAKDKIDLLGSLYKINMNNNIRKDINNMCNLGEGILERGIERGIKQSESNIIINMNLKHYSLEQISDITGKSMEEIKIIISKGQN